MVVWKARNARIFQGLIPNPTVIAETALAQHKNCVRWNPCLGKQSKSRINSLGQWMPSASGALKLVGGMSI